MLSKVKRYVKDPYYSVGYNLINKCPHLMSDKYYLSVLWKMIMGYELDWEHPKTFNEKLQWLKLHDRNPLYTTLVDKYRVKQWVADKIGEQYVIPTLAVYNSVDEIDLDKLPNQFVLKCNHDSGSVVICRDKTSFDLEAAKTKLGNALKNNFYWEAREWPYKNVKRCVFAEQFMKDATMDDGSPDSQVMLSEGLPKVIDTDFALFEWHKQKLYGVHWNLIEKEIKSRLCLDSYDFHANLKDAFNLFEKMREDMSVIRSEWYSMDNKLLFVDVAISRNVELGHVDIQKFGIEMDACIKLPVSERFDVGWLIVVDGFVFYLHHESSIPSFVGLKDYKWFCFNGEPKVMYIANDRAEFPTMNFYNMDFEPLPLYTKDPPAYDNPPKPKRFEEMKSLSSKLSRGIPQVRVDFYENDTALYFGEMTFFHGGGLSEIHPKEWNVKMGDWIKLPIDK
jgi:hypothetical protein